MDVLSRGGIHMFAIVLLMCTLTIEVLMVEGMSVIVNVCCL